MGQHQYSEEFKRKAVQKVILRNSGKSIDQVCEEIGITGPSFYDWRRKYANAPGMKKPGKRPQDWTPTEKFKAVLDFEILSESEQGEFLRSEGLHSEHLAAWKKSMQASLESSPKPSAEARAERAEDKRKILELERELRRKEKALAEAAALLILKKKADLIWGTGENE